ncbi:hypothetical protein BDF14DRAFT_84847 [Spinellus fusiger]|nr:hypothetical protein BDF14DRAFT_84847 [Spinellus fusiger]
MAMVREGTTGTLTALGMPDTTKTSEDTLLSFYESYTNGLETVSAQNSREERQSENWVGTSGAVPPPIAASHISHSDAAQSQTVHDHNPLQSLLENVLYDETFTPSYDLGMKHRLESLSQLVKQQESAWSLPTTKPEDINTLQPWLEQLSSNIQTGSCLYPDILSPHVDEQVLVLCHLRRTRK